MPCYMRQRRRDRLHLVVGRGSDLLLLQKLDHLPELQLQHGEPCPLQTLLIEVRGTGGEVVIDNLATDPYSSPRSSPFKAGPAVYPSAPTFFFRNATPTPTSTSADPTITRGVTGSAMKTVPMATASTGVA